MRRWLMFALLLGCHGSGGNMALPAAITAAAAVAEVITYRAAQGGCSGTCGPGAECNTQSGMCESKPCGGYCASDEVCDGPPGAERCTPKWAVTPAENECSPVPDAGSLLVVSCTGDAGS